MRYEIKITEQFRKDLDFAKEQGSNSEILMDVIDRLAEGEILSKDYRDGIFLKTSDEEIRKCHIGPEWVLFYEYIKKFLVLVFFKKEKRVIPIFLSVFIISFIFFLICMTLIFSPTLVERRKVFFEEKQYLAVTEAKKIEERRIEEQIRKLMTPKPQEPVVVKETMQEPEIMEVAVTASIDEPEIEKEIPDSSSDSSPNTRQMFYYVPREETISFITIVEEVEEQPITQPVYKEFKGEEFKEEVEEVVIEKNDDNGVKEYIYPKTEEKPIYFSVQIGEQQEPVEATYKGLEEYEQTRRKITYSLQPGINFAYMDYSGYRGVQFQPNTKIKAEIPFSKRFFVSNYVGFNFEKELKNRSVFISNPNGYAFELGAGIGYEWKKFQLSFDTGLVVRNLGTDTANTNGFISFGLEPFYRFFDYGKSSSVWVGTPIRLDVANNGVNFGGGLVFSFRFNENKRESVK